MKSQVEILIRDYLAKNPASKSRTIAQGIGRPQKSVNHRIALMDDVVAEKVIREGSAKVTYYTLGKPRKKLNDYSDVTQLIVRYSVAKKDEPEQGMQRSWRNIGAA